MKSIVLALLSLSVGTASSAAAEQVCQTVPEGNWKVASYWFEGGVVAVSTAEAKSRLGKPVSITSKLVTFPGYPRCIVQRKNVETSGAFSKFPRLVMYDCTNGAILPNIFVGKKCDKILASLDGANYALTRRR